MREFNDSIPEHVTNKWVKGRQTLSNYMYIYTPVSISGYIHLTISRYAFSATSLYFVGGRQAYKNTSTHKV